MWSPKPGVWSSRREPPSPSSRIEEHYIQKQPSAVSKQAILFISSRRTKKKGNAMGGGDVKVYNFEQN